MNLFKFTKLYEQVNHDKSLGDLVFMAETDHLGNKVEFIAYREDLQKDKISPELLYEAVRHVQLFNPTSETWFSREVWKHYIEKIRRTTFASKYGDSKKEVLRKNMEYFHIYSPEELCKSLTSPLVILTSSYSFPISFELHYSIPWNEEHSMIIRVTKGEFDEIE